MRFSHSFLCGVACVASVSCADPEPLALSTVSPPLGPTEGGTLVKITGENLRLGSQVTFGGTPALAVEFIDAEELRVVTPPGTEGAVDVSVTSPSGEQETLSGAFTYVAEPQQTLCEVAVSPAFGTQNVDVTTTFSATYSESVDASMQTRTLQRLRADGVWVDVPHTVTEDETSVRAEPTGSLAFFSEYAFSLAGVIADDDGATCTYGSTVVSTRYPEPAARELQPAPVHGFAVVGTTGLAVSGSYRGLQIYDLSDPAAPALTGSLETYERPISVVASGSRAYVPAGRDGVLIFDVSDPANPLRIGLAGTPGVAIEAVPFQVDARLLLAVADGPGGLRVIDVTDPEGATDVKWLHPSGEVSTYLSGIVSLGGARVAVAQNDQGFAIVDLSNPAQPIVETSRQSEVLPETFNKSLAVTDVASDGQELFVALGPHGFQAFDVALPVTPLYLDFAYGPEGHCPAYCTDLNRGIVANGGTLYAASYTTGIVSLDFSGGGFGPLVSWPLTGRTFGLTESGASIFAASERGLATFAKGSPDAAAPLFAEANGTGTVRSAALGESHLYVASASRGLETYSLADPLSPALVDVVTTAGVQSDDGTSDVAVDGDRLLLADGRLRLEVFDLTNPAKPSSLGVIAGGDSVNAIELSNGTAFVCVGNAAMMVIDYSGPSPTKLGEINLNASVSGCIGLKAVGDHLYVAGARALGVLDVSDPSQPTLLSTLELPTDEAVTALESYGDILYASTNVADWEGTYGVAQRLWAFDITARETPVRVFKSDELGASGRMVRAGDKLFMAASIRGVWVFGLGAPASPELEGGIPFPGLPARVVVDRDREVLYVPQNGGGLGVVSVGQLPQ